MYKDNDPTASVLLVVAGLLALAVGLLADYALYMLRLRVASTFSPGPVVVLSLLSAAALVVAACLGAVAWVALRRNPHRAAGVILLLLGLPVALMPLLSTLGLLRWVPMAVRVAQTNFFLMAGAMVVVLGVMVIGRRRGVTTDYTRPSSAAISQIEENLSAD